MKTHWKKAFDSPYVGSWDLDDYKPINVTISHVELKMTKGLKDNSNMNIAHFKENYKPMILNSTNSQMLKTITDSRYIEDWIDVPVTLYVLENIKAFGGIHDGLRIKAQPKPKTLPDLLYGGPKWIQAVNGIESGTVTVEQISLHYKLTKKQITELDKRVKK